MKMLGRRVRRYYWRFDGENWGWRTPDTDRSVRHLKFAEKRRWRKESGEEFAQYAEESLAIANETFEASAETWPRE